MSSVNDCQFAFVRCTDDSTFTCGKPTLAVVHLANDTQLAVCREHRDELVGDGLVQWMRSIDEERQHAAYQAGVEAGRGSGSWVDGNTSDDTKAALRRMIDDGDPELYDAMPSPLSGEWADNSILGLSLLYNVDLEDDEMATSFECGFAEGWEMAVAEAVTEEVMA